MGNNGRRVRTNYNTGPNMNQNAYELGLKQRAIQRAQHNENIIGEGYAERQIQDTLSKVEKIKTEL